ACYETATFNTTSCEWDVTGTQPVQPVIACYETATFNTTSCEWDVTGTQPVQPVIACYETATFNTTTCEWDVTGTQPVQPVMACYETATFNTTSCEWDVTGTQPVQPVIACYETATFNTTSCEWDVTGTQPVQPVIACYETATFNTTTCDWDVTGTQPIQPVMACYETATFNTTSCEWDVTGTQPVQPVLDLLPRTCIEKETVFEISNYDVQYTYIILPNAGVMRDGNLIKATTGNYTIEAMINGCSSPTTAFTVGSQICAVNDNIGVMDTAKNTTTDFSIFKNDILNGSEVAPSDVILSSPSSPFFTLNSNGTFEIAPNTPTGTYQIPYTICETSNPTNCSSAVVTVSIICNSTKVSGVIMNENSNTPLVNVPITLKPINGTTGATLIRITKTDGSYSFDGMIPGDYVLQVQDANLNTAQELFNTNPSFLILEVENCQYLERNFGYASTDLPVMGDFVWYDLNNNGIQDEWYDANNDGLVTQNMPDVNGVIDYSKWEWIDFNGDGSYLGKENAGELNAAGFGNGSTNVPNIFITGPNDYSRSITMGIQGYWRARADKGNYGEYRVEFIKESLMESASEAMAASGLVKVLPGFTKKRTANTQTAKSNRFVDCASTTNTVLFTTIDDTHRVRLDLDFGISCKTYATLEAKDDSISDVNGSSGALGVLNLLRNDIKDGNAIQPTDVIVTGINLPSGFVLHPNGVVDVAPNTDEGTYTFTYQICESGTSNCATATVTIDVVVPPAPAPIPDPVIIPILVVANDSATADGINGSVAFLNVLGNDSLDGTSINPSQISLQGLHLPKGIVLNPDGTIDVAPNTAGGNYVFDYQVCDIANPTNCKTATVNLFVESPSIALIKTAVFNDENGSGYANAGETITYSFTVVNTGNTVLENISISDPLPGIQIKGGPITLGVNQTDESTFTATYAVTQSDINAGKVVNQATVNATTASGIEVEDLSDASSLTADNPTIVSLEGCVIKVFNAMTLNGDGENERFYIQGIECYPENKVEIYNRWGVLVYESEHYNNVDHVFKGFSEGRVTVKETGGLPTGTYFYVLKYQDNSAQTQQQAGYLYITN
ncbi:T9SS type B sorting domain-containing protein, partial [Flavobacterium agrisoli]